ncbi:MAG: FecR domain-containing protein [Hyphomicrobiales bacterium]|nr:FecR domain-containing protein [Hyphomicrobiales bacterium]
MSRSPGSKMRMPLLSGVAALALLCPGASIAGTVGTAGAANTRSTGLPPGGTLRIIELGTQVVTDEKIETSATGSVQLVFIDKTTLNIGPNSTLVIDKFVFDPTTAQGQMALSLSKGVLRVVGGQATHTGGATITTPVATIGLRGGITSVTHSGSEGTFALLFFGKLSVTARRHCATPTSQAVADISSCVGETQTITRPGYGVTVTAGASPSTPVKVSAAVVDKVKNAVTSGSGQTGGSSVSPTEQDAANNNVGTGTSVVAKLPLGNQVQSASRLAATNNLAAKITQQGAQVTLSNPVVSTSQLIAPIKPTNPIVPPVGSFALATAGGFDFSRLCAHDDRGRRLRRALPSRFIRGIRRLYGLANPRISGRRTHQWNAVYELTRAASRDQCRRKRPAADFGNLRDDGECDQ